MTLTKHGILSGNQLKIIAVIAMTLDHIGVQILTDCEILRIIGRIAYPVFAYMIAEGCRYTRNRARYLIMMAVSALICQLVYFFAMNSLSQCILVTFTLSIALIYAFDNTMTKRDYASRIVALAQLVIVYLITEILPVVLKNTDFSVDYGFIGVMVPVFVYMGNTKMQKLFFLFAALLILSVYSGGIQWFCLLALVLLAIYNGERGKMRMKYFFYVYYPAHLVVIYLISCVV